MIMIDRRLFIQSAVANTAIAHFALTGTTCASPALAYREEKEQEKNVPPVVVGIMGLSRGLDLARDLVSMPGVTIKYACDTDSNRAKAGSKVLADLGGSAEPITDFRKILDDKQIDLLVCAAPNHWHGPATILGCKAGKHVYVEKPTSHNPAEGEWMIQAAERYQRCVQVGNQRRSAPEIQQAIAKVKSGTIGKVYLARTFYNRLRDSIGKSQPAMPPSYLDYELWQGPAPKRPYQANVIHYNWHWFWHWGNGELGNNGPHGLDLCRWGLGVDYPVRTVSSGGRYCHQDDQETPDTHQVAFEFADGKQITYQGLSCSQTPLGPFAAFYGTDGYLEMDGNGNHKIYDKKNKLVEETKGSGWGQKQHLENMIAAVRANDSKLLNQPILEGHKSTLLCHLGNIAHRSGATVHTDKENGRIVDNEAQQKLWRREYDIAWEKEITEIG
jgi:predicted dehydrogenase